MSYWYNVSLRAPCQGKGQRARGLWGHRAFLGPCGSKCKRADGLSFTRNFPKSRKAHMSASPQHLCLLFPSSLPFILPPPDSGLPCPSYGPRLQEQSLPPVPRKQASADQPKERLADVFLLLPKVELPVRAESPHWNVQTLPVLLNVASWGCFLNLPPLPWARQTQMAFFGDDLAPRKNTASFPSHLLSLPLVRPSPSLFFCSPANSLLPFHDIIFS